MNSIIKSAKLSNTWLKNNAILVTAVRNHWNKDYKPGPYPKTEAERVAAADKYGLHPSEYKPYPDDGQGCGDYPNLPMVSGDSKDPFYPWDNPELKRNFNEPVCSNGKTELQLEHIEQFCGSAHLYQLVEASLIFYF
ncbi:unnamed protein product [Acanthoscelides obtectus]|uniref:Uncharacterized protein n=1 Tax=Acanthoscelides obtectus TaxID=200917 RepID=A0A9P0L8S9_ACAOB|nr:unnamed protein product [Acanthoscelides obtectus]CAK1635946.1 NADH dehydrogenase [ubiquinone] 1 beta subcomplex subunit 8, mitochondrial [Acanthoscelides obtectus]